MAFVWKKIMQIYELRTCWYPCQNRATHAVDMQAVMKTDYTKAIRSIPSARFCGDQFELCECNILLIHKGHMKQSILNARFWGTCLNCVRATSWSSSKQCAPPTPSCPFVRPPLSRAKVIGKAVTVLQQTWSQGHRQSCHSSTTNFSNL